MDDPQLELDASLKSVVEGERYRAVLKAVEEAAEAHSLALMARHGRAMRLVGDLLILNPVLLREWKHLKKFSLDSLMSRFESARRKVGVRRLLGGKLSGDRLRVLECAMVCAHLREAAAASFLDLGVDVGHHVTEALWFVPMDVSPSGTLLSWFDMPEPWFKPDSKL